eukprot:15454841-Alexandrium_andersonii.AAC.1
MPGTRVAPDSIQVSIAALARVLPPEAFHGILLARSPEPSGQALAAVHSQFARSGRALCRGDLEFRTCAQRWVKKKVAFHAHASVAVPA